MSSFSSVIRKPGAKPAPKVAPRRNIVRKPAQNVAENSLAEATNITDSPSREVGPSSKNDDRLAVDAIEESRVAVSQSQAEVTEGHRPELEVAADVESFADQERRTIEEVPSTIETAAPSATASAEQDVNELHSELPMQTQSENTPAKQISVPPRSPRRSRRVQVQAPAVDSNTTSATATTSEPQAPATSPPETTVRASVRPSIRGRRDGTRSSSRTPHQAQLATPPTTQPSPRPARAGSSASVRAASITSQRSEAQEALDRVNSQFRRVGDIAASIIRDTPTESSAEPDGERPRKRRRRNATEQAADIVAAVTEASSGRRRDRGPTPVDAEAHVVEPENTTMFDLCNDKHKWGKKSTIEKEMAANWTEILARRREDANERFEKAQQGRRKKDKLSIPEVTDGDMGAVPELVIENGQLVVASRDVDRHADTTNIANAVTDADIREDTDIYKRINSATVGPQRGHIAPGQYWDDLSTEMFYSGLKMFGTDFKMISNMIPGKNRKQVKLKYNVEERINWNRVRRCLDQKEEVSLDSYAHMTGIEFGNAADVYKQMEEDEKKLREEDETRRREEGIISRNAEADVALPSIEEGEAGEDGVSTTTASRLGSTTTSVRQATAGKKGKAKKRQTAKNKQTFEGVEERLGDVTEIGIPGS